LGLQSYEKYLINQHFLKKFSNFSTQKSLSYLSLFQHFMRSVEKYSRNFSTQTAGQWHII